MVSSTLVIQYKWYIGSHGKQRLAVWGIAHGWPKVWEKSGRHNAAFVVDCEDAGDSKGDTTTVSTLVLSIERERIMDETATRNREGTLDSIAEFKDLSPWPTLKNLPTVKQDNQATSIKPKSWLDAMKNYKAQVTKWVQQY